ncbi:MULTISPECIES: RidA family protein [unclassified Chelatococcus]|uniref:RidA family protein n=1 Tax=unclassified Chelatococcus TaxID=2638111 RepID=UPI0020BED7C4|nr:MULTISPECIES: RidA family protein [unclassified Chelatococcus]
MKERRVFMHKKLKSSSAYEERYSYSRAVVIGDWVLVSNTAGRNHATKEMPTTPLGQLKQTIDNIQKALQAAGADLEDIVRARIYIPDPSHHPELLEHWGERFRGIDPVATITACPLASKDYLVEIEVTAYKGARETGWEREAISLA